MELNTPSRGTAFPRIKLRFDGSSRPAVPPKESTWLMRVRQMAEAVIKLLPADFDRVLPRGYSVENGSLLMTRLEAGAQFPAVIYSRSAEWRDREAREFLADLKDGWLDELSSFMRWQLRADPIMNAQVQYELVQLQYQVSKPLTVI